MNINKDQALLQLEHTITVINKLLYPYRDIEKEAEKTGIKADDYFIRLIHLTSYHGAKKINLSTQLQDIIIDLNLFVPDTDYAERLILELKSTYLTLPIGEKTNFYIHTISDLLTKITDVNYQLIDLIVLTTDLKEKIDLNIHKITPELIVKLIPSCANNTDNSFNNNFIETLKIAKDVLYLLPLLHTYLLFSKGELLNFLSAIGVKKQGGDKNKINNTTDLTATATEAQKKSPVQRASTLKRYEQYKTDFTNFQSIEGKDRLEAIRLTAEKYKVNSDTIERALGWRK